ncbi:S8 family peptidase [Chitinophaga tropicalis]|uniref:S8 family serine peptidase n=1 Tax=Chitinophaga tropicalis TaxID=2683588 RepID=A0A7K1U251_9BACT|nr:S8 family serine peptidase [Chitinophaga tropicalis]MVT08454.1 S8 family serine peptidase [Chitinophaga tropicalis]
MKRIQLLPLALPLMMLIMLASCQKDEKTLNVRNGVINGPQKKDRGFIIIAEEGAKLKGISESLANLEAKKLKITEVIEELGLIHVQTPDPSFPEKARKLPGVESVAVDVVMNWRLPSQHFRSDISYNSNAAAAPNVIAKSSAPAATVTADPLSYLQWGLNSVKAQQAWAKGYSGKGVKVAVLDGGFLLSNPEIAPNILLSHSFIDGEEAQYHGLEGFSHGSHVAGTIAAASNARGVVGVAPDVKLLLIKVISDAGSGPWSSLIDGIFYAVNHGAKVINMSLGGELPRKTYTDDNGTPDDPSDDYVVEYDRDVKDLVKALNRATLFATLRGTTLIAAAGNDAYNYDVEKRFITYPAACLGVLSIASNGPVGWGINQDTTLYVPSIFTNYGKSFISYGAPGGNYTLPPNTTIVTVGTVTNYDYVFGMVFNIGFWDEPSNTYYYGWAAGTSMAAPHASAVAALLYGKYSWMNPVLLDIIFKASSNDYGAPGKDAYFGFGQLNAGKAVSL